MRKLVIIFITLYAVSLQAQTLSGDAEISVLTVGPGTSLNDAFGHSAFRIKDNTNGLDVVYGYGEYDFDAPNFYLKFAQGKLQYLISKTDFKRFYRIYEYFNRSIDEQVLNLNISQKQKLYDFLLENYKPANRRYLYDFFFDNCATKIKDVVNISTSNTVTYNTPSDYKAATTFRTLIQNNLNRNSWGSLGIDIALGAVIDQEATPEQHMFLPKNIYSFFENATLNNVTPLVKQSRVIYKAKPKKVDSSFFSSPIFILGILGLLIIFFTYKDYKNKKRTIILDVIIFTITGLAGVVILLLWLTTDHESTHNNYNLLWANPLNLIVLFQAFKKQPSHWFNKYLKFLVILLCLLTFHWITGVQIFAVGLIPLIFALLVRYVFLAKRLA
ncbi:DUF4105 domain-containing protein [Flavobacteriaceae bacterium MHTCC 0001]